MSNIIQEYLEGKIDFAGQNLVDLISKATLAGSGVLAFIVGFVLQDIRITFAIMGLATVTLALLVLPPWPIFNRNPVKWLPVKNTKTE